MGIHREGNQCFFDIIHSQFRVLVLFSIGESPVALLSESVFGYGFDIGEIDINIFAGNKHSTIRRARERPINSHDASCQAIERNSQINVILIIGRIDMITPGLLRILVEA